MFNAPVIWQKEKKLSSLKIVFACIYVCVPFQLVILAISWRKKQIRIDWPLWLGPLGSFWNWDLLTSSDTPGNWLFSEDIQEFWVVLGLNENWKMMKIYGMDQSPGCSQKKKKFLKYLKSHCLWDGKLLWVL